MITILLNLVFVIAFHVKIQHKTINLSFCFVFASIKLPRHNTIIFQIKQFFVIFLLHCYRRPLLSKDWHIGNFLNKVLDKGFYIIHSIIYSFNELLTLLKFDLLGWYPTRFTIKIFLVIHFNIVKIQSFLFWEFHPYLLVRTVNHYSKIDTSMFHVQKK